MGWGCKFMQIWGISLLKLTSLSRMPVKLYHPNIPPWSLRILLPPDPKHLFDSSPLRFLSLQTSCLPAAPANPIFVWGRNQLAGMTITLSSNLKFSCRFCVELLDAFLSLPQLIIIWLGSSVAHRLSSRGSSQPLLQPTHSSTGNPMSHAVEYWWFSCFCELL